MHFALPTPKHKRGSSSPFLGPTAGSAAHYTRYVPYAARRPLTALVTFIIVVLLLRSWTSGDDHPRNSPRTVVVTCLNRTGYSEAHIQRVIENRREYARAHGYGLFLRNVTDYDIGKVPGGWARIPTLRHAMTEYQWSDNFWYLDQDAIIMNPALSLEQHILAPKRLGTQMRRDVPVVPPDSVIRTYKHVQPDKIMLIISQDHDGLQPGSMIIRRSEWAKYFLDAWYDPMFRFYNFQKAEQHALEHIVQWHPTILTKLALVPQKLFNSYPSVPGGESTYEEGDFVVHFHECEKPERSCEKEFNRYWEQRSTVVV